MWQTMENDRLLDVTDNVEWQTLGTWQQTMGNTFSGNDTQWWVTAMLDNIRMVNDRQWGSDDRSWMITW